MSICYNIIEIATPFNNSLVAITATRRLKWRKWDVDVEGT